MGARDLLDVVCPAERVLESLPVPIPHDLVARVAESGAELAAAVEKVGHRDGGHGRDRPILGRTVSVLGPSAEAARAERKFDERKPGTPSGVVKRLKAEAEKELADTGVQIGSANSDGRL